ncbi:hypothetical protein [Phreatobacter aquaticus]|nr:hypothetical protein [Phreatobacter aquaticus]
MPRRVFLAVSPFVMPAHVAGIHAFYARTKEGVDGRDKPGHDAERDGTA